MDALDQQLMALLFEKFDIQNDTAEGNVENLISVGIKLERARVSFLALNPDADFIDVAQGLIGLADIFDDADLSPDQLDALKGNVAKILKITDPVKIQAATDLFVSVLDAGTTAKAAVEYLDENLIQPDEV